MTPRVIRLEAEVIPILLHATVEVACRVNGRTIAGDGGEATANGAGVVGLAQIPVPPPIPLEVLVPGEAIRATSVTLGLESDQTGEAVTTAVGLLSFTSLPALAFVGAAVATVIADVAARGVVGATRARGLARVPTVTLATDVTSVVTRGVTGSPSTPGALGAEVFEIPFGETALLRGPSLLLVLPQTPLPSSVVPSVGAPPLVRTEGDVTTALAAIGGAGAVSPVVVEMKLELVLMLETASAVVPRGPSTAEGARATGVVAVVALGEVVVVARAVAYVTRRRARSTEDAAARETRGTSTGGITADRLRVSRATAMA